MNHIYRNCMVLLCPFWSFKTSFIHSTLVFLERMWMRKLWQNFEFWVPFLFRGQADHLHVVKTVRKDHIDSRTLWTSHPPHIHHSSRTDLLFGSRVSEMLTRNNQATERCFNTSHLSQGRRPCRSGPCLNLYGSSSHISVRKEPCDLFEFPTREMCISEASDGSFKYILILHDAYSSEDLE